MRLLHHLDDGHFRLEEFAEDNKPSYAILSHTWLVNSSEVTYNDLKKGNAQNKTASYNKIRFCVEQAARDGLEYSWVDTCCIDKSSSMELQEAITIMFSWYRHAAKCYVYLSDVSATERGSAYHPMPWELAFRQSRWFKRGWTLQELIAPKTVEFFSTEGIRLGDKQSLSDLIHQVTGIPHQALEGADMDSFSVAERLSWMQDRQTKRREDMGYSMLGIFGIFMPLLYGEGTHALTRLDAEIQKKHKADARINEVLSKLPVVPRAAFDSIENQYATTCLPNTRGELLQEIIDWVYGPDKRCIFWLNGLAGTGKSTVAHTIARNHHESRDLAASFFFVKGGGDRKDADKFVTTIARQLADRVPLVREHICEAIKKQEDIANHALRDQWKHLIIGPLKKLGRGLSPSPLLIVVDALDECDQERDIELIIKVLATARSLDNIRLRILVTSRPDILMQPLFYKISETDREGFVLHEISPELLDNHPGALIVEQIEPENPRGGESWSLPPSHTNSPTPGLFNDDGESSEHGGGATSLSNHNILAATDSGYGSTSQPRTMSIGKEWSHLPTLSEQLQESSVPTAQTIYTSSMISTTEQHGYIANLAEELSSLIHSLKPDENMLEHMIDAVPELLRAFALRIGYNTDHKAAHREIAVFVHKRRFHIQNLIRSGEASPGMDSDEEDARNRSADNGELLLGRYVQEADPEEYLPIDAPPEGSWTLEDEVAEPSDTNDYDKYQEIMQTSQAYDWLVTAIDREIKLVRGTPDIMKQIKSSVLSFLPEVRKISRSEPSQVHMVEFALQWNPLSFAKHQYAEVPLVSLERAITLTGSVNDAQALTTREYLVQTWPLTGSHIMNLVNDVLRTTVGHISSCTLPDRTKVEACLKDDTFIVAVTGIAESIVEVGQQFGWLGAALRSSPFETGIAPCRPIVERNVDSSSSITDMTQTINGVSRVLLTLSFLVSLPFAETDSQRWGTCWHPMFKNPVMVVGYPILSRRLLGFGLEMPLNMMGELSGTSRLDSFDGKIFLKGFSTMLIATKQAQDIIIWHYLYNTNKGRISYMDHTIGKIDDIDLWSLDKARHIIGWCPDCKVMTGDPLLSSRVRESNLPRPHSGCLLEKANLSFSHFISGGVSFAVGVKDVPPHLIRNGYIPSLRWISTKYVILWDEEEKRGWLVNGTSALLHIVQATLQHWAKDDFSDAFLFDSNKLVNVANYRSNSASRILSHRGNQELEIYPGRTERFDEEEIMPKGKGEGNPKTAKKKQGYYIFQDLVELRLKALEQIFEHQERLAGKNGINIKKRLRPHLEGWDFVEIATDMDPRPRVATLERSGYGWVDFVRSIGAITLFGKGFGDIIVPRERGICPVWETLPKGQYNLAVPTLDILKIIKNYGDKESGPLQTIQELAWHSPDGLAAAYQCQCQQSHWVARKLWGGSRKHKSPVQILLPMRYRLILPIRSPQELKESGAVIFGQHDLWKYRWKKDGREDVEEWPSPTSQAQSSAQSRYGDPATPSHNSSDETRSQSTNNDGSLLALRTTLSVLKSSESSITTQSTLTGTLSNPVDTLSSLFRTASVEGDGTQVSSRSLTVEDNRARRLRYEKRRTSPRDR